MTVNLELTDKYYLSEKSEPCSCNGCRNYISRIKTEFPAVAEYLAKMKVDILRPFELIYIELGETVEYQCQYVVFGKCEDDFYETVDGIEFTKCTSHPSTDIDEEHFVLEFGTVVLKNAV